MVDAFRSMLDELMGKERDAPLHARSNRKLTFSDPDVCKHELAAVCPHQLFTNTRSDLGESGRAGLRLRACMPAGRAPRAAAPARRRAPG